MLNYIIIVAILLCGAGDHCEVHPLVFPAQMPPAAQMISDILSEEDTWRAEITDFLNNSTNQTGQMIA